MKRDNVNYFVVGLFVLAMLMSLLVVIYKLTGRSGENDYYYMTYNNISGLTKGDPVKYEGFQLGHVELITAAQDNEGTHYRVDIKVQDDWRIPVDSIAKIDNSGLLSDVIINISEGDSQEMHVLGAKIEGAPSDDVFAAIGAMATDLKGLTQTTIKPLLINLNNRITSVGQELDTHLPVIFSDLQSLVASINTSMQRLNGILSVKNEGSINRIIKNADSASSNIASISDDLKITQTKLNGLLDSANKMIDESEPDIRQSSIALRQSLETVSQYIDTVLLNLEGTSRNLYEFSRHIRQNPGLLISGSPPEDKGSKQ